MFHLPLVQFTAVVGMKRASDATLFRQLLTKKTPATYVLFYLEWQIIASTH